jgi:hypothetical protein
LLFCDSERLDPEPGCPTQPPARECITSRYPRTPSPKLSSPAHTRPPRRARSIGKRRHQVPSPTPGRRTHGTVPALSHRAQRLPTAPGSGNDRGQGWRLGEWGGQGLLSHIFRWSVAIGRNGWWARRPRRPVPRRPAWMSPHAPSRFPLSWYSSGSAGSGSTQQARSRSQNPLYKVIAAI